MRRVGFVLSGLMVVAAGWLAWSLDEGRARDFVVLDERAPPSAGEGMLLHGVPPRLRRSMPLACERAASESVRGEGSVAFVDSWSHARLTSGRWRLSGVDEDGRALMFVVDLQDDPAGSVEIPAGDWRMESVDAGFRASPSSVSVAKGERHVVQVSSELECRVFVCDDSGRALAGVPVLAAGGEVSPWFAGPTEAVDAVGVSAERGTTDASGYATLRVRSSGDVTLCAVSAERGIASRTVSREPGALHELRLHVSGSGRRITVFDAVTGEPVENAVLNEGVSVLGSVSDANGSITLFHNGSAGGSSVVSAPGFVPVLVPLWSVEDGARIALRRQSELAWELVAPNHAKDGDLARDSWVGLAPITIGFARQCLPRWSLEQCSTGSFVVPADSLVEVHAVSGDLSARNEVRVDSPVVTTRLDLVWSEGLDLGVSPTQTISHVEVVYRDSTRMRLELRAGMGTVARPSTVESLRLETGSGAFVIEMSPVAEHGSCDRLDVALPAASVQSFDVTDRSGMPLTCELVFDSQTDVAKSARSSCPAWVVREFQPSSRPVPMLEGSGTASLPPGRYAFQVRRLASPIILGEGRIEVGEASGEHPIVVDGARWVDASVDWADGRPAAEFEIRYAVPWAEPGSPWSLRMSRGAHGAWAGWMPAVPLDLLVTADGAQHSIAHVDALGGSFEVTLVAQPAEMPLVVVGRGPGAGQAVGNAHGVLLSLYSQEHEYIETVYVPRGPTGRFVVPDANILEGRLVTVMVETDDAEYESDLMSKGRLMTGPVEVVAVDG